MEGHASQQIRPDASLIVDVRADDPVRFVLGEAEVVLGLRKRSVDEILEVIIHDHGRESGKRPVLDHPEWRASILRDV